MKEWYDTLPGKPTPEPVRGKHFAAWPENQKLSQPINLDFCPVAFSELHMIASHIPIIATVQANGPEIMLDLRRDRLVAPPVDKGGAWQLNYVPLALRLLPFTATAAGIQERLINLHLGPNLPRSKKEQAEMKAHLVKFSHGRKRLTDAAQILIEEGFLKKEKNSIRCEVDLGAAFQNKLNRPHAQAFRLLMVIIFSHKNYIYAQKFSAFQLSAKNYLTTPQDKENFLLSYLSAGSSIVF